LTDVCLSYSNFDESAGTVDLHMVNTVDVAGFQVELEGSTIASAAGGFAEAARRTPLNRGQAAGVAELIRRHCLRSSGMPSEIERPSIWHD